MSNATTTKQYLHLIKKIINTINKIDKIDRILENKYNKNIHESESYQKILDDTNKNFYIIIKNLK